MSKKKQSALDIELMKENSEKKNFPNKKSKIKPAKPSPVKWVWLAAILVFTWFSFSPSMENKWTNWDDPVYVLENPLVTNPNTPLNEIIKTPVSLNYHPLTILSLKWNYDKVKAEPYAYHLTNVFLHLFNTALVFFFLLLLSDSLVIAVFASALFGIHPMHVESVTWIAERKDVLYVFFFLLGLISYLKYLDGKKIFWLVITFLAFVLSCASKAMAVVFPIVLLLIDYLKEREWNFRIITEKIIFFLFSLYIGFEAYQIQSTDAIAKANTFTILQRVCFASYGAWFYVVKFFAPVQLSAFYPYPLSPDGVSLTPEYYIAPIGLLAAFGILIILLKKNRVIVFGLSFYFVSVALVLQFISVGSAIAADRYSYLSYIGLVFLLGWVLNLFFKEGKKLFQFRFAAAALAGIICFTLSYQTYQRTQVWKNSETLWTDVIEKYPHRIEVAYKNRGNYYGREANKFNEALADYKVLLAMQTKDSKVYSNLGNIYGLMKKGDSAIWAYNKALELDANNEDGYMNRGITYSMAGMNDKAVQDFTNYIRLQPNNATGYYYRGIAYVSIGNSSAGKADIIQARNLGYNVDPKYLK
ncbi:MAG TPA: hypothetical protein DCQ93_10220 [Bacteroidetes bacterium]|mgnify:FL=1|nr:hypothetical protein [Bacteroidota bacterium]